ncbi:hypothetical protein KUV89_11980 [Marinobacter hydrocarbonoclasticus]|nr:hypothetical protein [Marinobacter nauticus]
MSLIELITIPGLMAGAGTGRVQCSYVYRANGDTRGRNRAALVIEYDSRSGDVVLIER